jgi:PAS domain S-box-containing protein
MVQKKKQVNKEISSSSRTRIGKRAALEELQTMYDSLSDMIMILDRDHKIMMANKATADFLKLPMDKIIGNTCFKLMHGTNGPIPQCPLEKMVESIEREEIELYFGERGIWARVMVYPIFDRKRSLVRIIHIVRDITEGKRAEEELGESKQRFEAIFNGAIDGLLLADLDTGKFNIGNRRICEMLGYERDEIKKIGFDDIHPEDALAHVLEQVGKQVAGKITVAKDLPVKRKNGSIFYADIAASPLQIGGKPFLLGIFRDITERKKAEEALKESEQKFRTIFDKASDGMFLVDLETRKFSLCNTMCSQMLGYAQEEFLNLEIADIHPPTDLPLVFEQIEKFMKGEEGVRHDLRFRRKDGSLFFADLSPALLTLAGRKSLLIVYKDITERKKAEETLKQTLSGLRIALGGIIQVLAAITEKRDPYTGGHQRRVADLARAIGQEMGFTAERLEGLLMAGIIHDIGKVSVPAEILSNPNGLTKYEYELIKAHPQVAYDILKDVNFSWPIAEMVLQHHERMNGSGYPRGLKGDDILLEARILAVADVVEAMASHRPYRPARGVEAALEEIEKNKGILYDPLVVSACVTLFREQKFSLK